MMSWGMQIWYLYLQNTSENSREIIQRIIICVHASYECAILNV